MKRRRRLLLGWLAVGLLVLFWARAGVALAHAVLVAAEPAPNSILKTAPTRVWILFSEPVVPAFSRIAVFAQSGQPVDKGDLKPGNSDNTALAVTLPSLSNGTYLVSWEVQSAVDGHTTAGSFPFGVGISQLSSAPGSAPPTPPQVTPPDAVARWLNLTGLALLFGLFAFRLFIWHPALNDMESDGADEQLDLGFGRAGLKAGVLGQVLVGAGLVLTLIVQSSQANLFNGDNLMVWLGTRFGSMWLVRLGLAIGAGLLLARLSTTLGQERSARKGQHSWEWWAGLLVAGGLILTTSLVSHSAALSIDATQALAVDVLHGLAAATWVGGLLQLGLALWQARQLDAGSRAWLDLSLTLNFSALAAGAVGVLVLSGGYLAWKHIASWTALFGTAYGLTLLAKMALALPAFAVAAINLLIIKPRLDAAFDHPEAVASLKVQRRFGRLVWVEAAFALLVLAATGLLTDLQRAQDAPLLTQPAGKTVLTQSSGGPSLRSGQALNVTLTLEPALVGQNRFDVYLTDVNGRPIANASQVSLRFTFLGQSLGTASADAASLGDGHYRVDGGYLSLVGPWQIEVAIRRPDAFDAFSAFRVDAGLSGAIRPVGGQASLPERLAQFLTRSGGAVTGAFLMLFAIGWAFLAGRAAKWRWQMLPLLVPAIIVSWIGAMQLTTFFREFTPAKFTTNPILPDAASIARGQGLYEAHCVACHGESGRGDGPQAAGLSPKPADFTSGHTDSHPDGDVYYWIKNGIPNSAMPAFGSQLSDEEAWNLVNYIRRLSAQGRQPPTPAPARAPAP